VRLVRDPPRGSDRYYSSRSSSCCRANFLELQACRVDLLAGCCCGRDAHAHARTRAAYSVLVRPAARAASSLSSQQPPCRHSSQPARQQPPPGAARATCASNLYGGGNNVGDACALARRTACAAHRLHGQRQHPRNNNNNNNKRALPSRCAPLITRQPHSSHASRRTAVR
jgi:hypothetical protein